MNFNAPLLRPVRILLFPFSLVYAAAIWTRNRLFDRQLLRSASFNLPIICVGNLSAGGTGKSPMVEFLIQQLRSHYDVAVVSRGYKRKTRGYALAGETTTALEIGDEPMQFHTKFPGISVAVGEERIVAIPQLLHDRPKTEVILLDDAFQHRSVTAGMNILLTDYNNLFTRDWFLPTGDLRDEKGSYRRAGLLVVTKCPTNMTGEERDELKDEIGPHEHQQLFFTSIRYGDPYHILHRNPVRIHSSLEVLLVTGIADPRPLKRYLQDHAGTYYEILFADHHIYTIDDWKDIMKRFDSLQANNKIILTTEKDAMRLIKFGQGVSDVPVYVLPIEIEFLFNDAQRFMDMVTDYINTFSAKQSTKTNEQEKR